MTRCPKCGSARLLSAMPVIFAQQDDGFWVPDESDETPLGTHDPFPGATVLCNDCEHEWVPR